MSKQDDLTAEEKADFKRWKEHVLSTKDGSFWLKDSVGKEVEVYCARAPKVNGKVKALDLRFGKVVIENGDEVVEISMGAIQQVRYRKP